MNTLVQLHSRKNIIVPDIQVYHSQESQQKKKRNTIKKYHRSESDPIHCLFMMKLAHSVFPYKEQSILAQAIYVPVIHVLCQMYEWNIPSWDLLTVRVLFVLSAPNSVKNLELFQGQ